MDYFTNSLLIALVMGALTFAIVYVYLKKTMDKDDESGPDMRLCGKIAGLTALCTLLAVGYLNFAHGQKEEAALTTEFFEIGQVPF
jgi:hypothetical protein